MDPPVIECRVSENVDTGKLQTTTLVEEKKCRCWLMDNDGFFAGGGYKLKWRIK